MADFGQFANRIRELGRRVETGSDELVIKTALAVSQTVTLATPVDTGRARGNWQAEVGTPATEEVDREDESGRATIEINAQVIQTYEGTAQAVYLSNNLPYIGRLNEGHSAQAPAGFVEQAVAEGVRAVRGTRVTH